jgi:ketosteroid isomerase-like protein
MFARAGLGIAALSLIGGACAAEMNPEVAQAAADEAARAQITARSAAFADAFRSGDVATLVATSTDDIIVAGSWGRDVGLAEAEEFWRGFFDTSRVVSLELTIDPLLISGDMAIETGDYAETIVMGDDPPLDITGTYIMVWRRGAGDEWRIQRFIAADLMTAE